MESQALETFEDCARRPREAHAASWKRIWEEVGSSVFWRGKMGSPAVDTPPLSAFPVTTYGDYREAIERSFQSGENELSGKEILFWAQSSGTTGYRKLFPLTRAFRAEFQRVTPPFIAHLARRFPAFLDKAFLFAVATAPEEVSPTGIEVGFISHFNYRSTPEAVRKNYAWPIEILGDSRTCEYWGPLYALARDLGAIAAITPAVITQFGKRLLKNWDSYQPYLDGKEDPPAPLPPLGMSAERLACVRRAFAAGQTGFAALWPNLQFVVCWTSASAGMQLPELENFLEGKIPLVEGTYSATEGWMTVPLVEERGGALHIGGHVIEFCRAADATPEACGPILPPWELQVGEDYEILLTTSMGFIRYRLFDVVRCLGFHHGAPIIEFQYKSGSMIAIGQVRFAESNLLRALDEGGLKPAGRMVFGPNPGGDRFVCYVDAPVPGLGEKLRLVQGSLARLNPEYQDELDAGLMEPLAAVLVSRDDPFWDGLQASHAQGKRPLLTRQACRGEFLA